MNVGFVTHFSISILFPNIRHASTRNERIIITEFLSHGVKIGRCRLEHIVEVNSVL